MIFTYFPTFYVQISVSGCFVILEFFRRSSQKDVLERIMDSHAFAIFVGVFSVEIVLGAVARQYFQPDQL